MGNQQLATTKLHNQILTQNASQISPSSMKQQNKQNISADKKKKKCEFVYLEPKKVKTQQQFCKQYFDEVMDSRQKKTQGNSDNTDTLRRQSVKNQITKVSQNCENKRQTLQDKRMNFKKKDYLEDYIHIKQIERAEFGTIEKIQMKNGGLFRAAKIIKIASLHHKKGAKQNFLSQIALLSKLDHPNIVKIYQVFQWSNQYIVIMDLCEGGDLVQLIRESKQFGQGKVSQAMKQLFSGILYLHKNRIVHRNLKMQNILYDKLNGRLKIIDFSKARQIKQGQKLKDYVSCPFYSAPETIRDTYDQKCDIWSCGVILYILLSGRPPFQGTTLRQLEKNIKNTPLSFSSPLWKNRSLESKKLITKMLNKNPNQRISASQLLKSAWIFHTHCHPNKQVPVEKEVLTNLSSFYYQNRLKTVVHTFIAQQLYTDKDKQKFIKIFQSIDKDHDGFIQKQELLHVFRNHPEFQNLTQGRLQKIVKRIDTDQSGKIDFTEFLVAASDQQQLLNRKKLENAFMHLDADHNGEITSSQINIILGQTQQSNQQIKKIFEQVDINGDGKISKKQFISLLLNKK